MRPDSLISRVNQSGAFPLHRAQASGRDRKTRHPELAKPMEVWPDRSTKARWQRGVLQSSAFLSVSGLLTGRRSFGGHVSRSWQSRLGSGVIGLGLIALLAACTGPGGGDRIAGAGRPAAAKMSAWQAVEQQYGAMGTVAYAQDLVVTADTGVYAYDRATGRRLWRLAPPGGDSRPGIFCGSGQSAAAGLLPVGLGVITNPGTHGVTCSAVGLVNLRTGKLAWSHSVPTRALAKGTDIPPDGIVTEISGGIVVAAWGRMASAFSATGKRLWATGYNEFIDDLAVARGKSYLAFSTPAPFPDEPPVAIDSIDTATGRITSRLHLTAQMTHTLTPDLGYFVSTDPVTVLVFDDSTAAHASYLVLDPAGRHVAQVIPAGVQLPSGGWSILDASVTSAALHSHPYIRTIVGGGKLISLTGGRRSGGIERLAAYDLSSGTRVWTAAPAGVSIVAPIAVVGSAVLAAGIGIASKQPVLIRVSLGSGKMLSATPRPTGTGGNALGTLFRYFHFTLADDRIYAVDWNMKPLFSKAIPQLFTMSAGG